MKLTNSSLENSVDTMGRKLDDLLAAVSSIAQRQQLHEEIIVEMVTFLQTFREESLGGQQANLQEVQEASLGLAAMVSELARSTLGLGEAVRSGVGEVAGRIEGIVTSHHRTLLRLVNSGLRNRPVSAPRIRCVFLVHMIEAWDAQAEVYHSMLRDPRFDPVVVSINRRFPGNSGYSGEEIVSAALDGQAIDHIRLGTQSFDEAHDMLSYLAPDVIFRQSHWDVDYPPAFATEALAFARLCVIPYGMSMVRQFTHSEPTPSYISSRAFDQPYHRSAWRIFCETEQTKAYFASFHHSVPDKLVLSGYPKNARLTAALGKGVWPIGDTGKKAFKVIWAPHHSLGDDWLAFGVFHNICADMLLWARSAPDIEFVLKPHPALFSYAVSDDYLSQDAMDAFRRDWQALPNCAISEGQYGELFAASDLMLTDGVAFLAEYQLFDKPLIFFDSQRHVPFNELGLLAEACADRVTTFRQAREAILDYAAGRKWGNEENRARLRSVMMPNQRPAADIIMDCIASGLGVVGQPENSSES